MLIKSITKTGKPVLFGPTEVASKAVMLGTKKKNTDDKTFWVPKETIKIDTCNFIKHPDESWEATTTGSAEVGYTDMKTDQFSIARTHQFLVKYKSGVNEFGIPSIIITDASFDQVMKNPAKLVGDVDTTNTAPELLVGELAVENLKSTPTKKLKK